MAFEANIEWLLDNFQLVDDGTMDTVIECIPTGQEFRFDGEYASNWRDPVTGALNVEEFLLNAWEMDEISADGEDDWDF